ncbi:hypothetical protein ACOACO_02925 [Nocardioides sp. CPCC 205120]|uniref:hypothetical protein n=1 Tax=Nocardioides sp. CPCC 205120 TaxID=3406462 RepID=UPI003B504927
MAAPRRRRRPTDAEREEWSNSEYPVVRNVRLELEDAALFAGRCGLQLHSVDIPEGFLARLPELTNLDLVYMPWTDVDLLAECPGLRELWLGNMRRVTSLDGLRHLGLLRFLGIRGLSSLEELPSFATLQSLLLLDMASLKRLTSLLSVFDAPALRALFLMGVVPMTMEAARLANQHPSLREFTWWSEGVPERVAAPVIDAVHLPLMTGTTHHGWLAAQPEVLPREEPEARP